MIMIMMIAFTPWKSGLLLLINGSGSSNPSGFEFSDDDDCFYYHSWRNHVGIAFGTLSSFLT